MTTNALETVSVCVDLKQFQAPALMGSLRRQKRTGRCERRQTKDELSGRGRS